RRRPRAQAGGPGPAHPHRADRQDREPAHLRGREHPRADRDPGAPEGGGRRRVAHVYASPLERARRTAEIARGGSAVPLTLVDDLRELSLGDWEGCTVEEIR